MIIHTYRTVFKQICLWGEANSTACNWFQQVKPHLIESGLKLEVNVWHRFPLPSQSWRCPSWRRFLTSPTSCLRRPRWWKTPRWGGRSGHSPTCAASTSTRPSAPLPRRQMRKWFRGSNRWRAPRRRDTRVQNTITCPEASLSIVSPNCCSSSALCTQLNTHARTQTQKHSHSCRDAHMSGYEDAHVNWTHSDMIHRLTLIPLKTDFCLSLLFHYFISFSSRVFVYNKKSKGNTWWWWNDHSVKCQQLW